jgi:hypothetical protein
MGIPIAERRMFALQNGPFLFYFYLDSRRRSLSVEAGFILTSTWHQQKEPAWTDIG